MKFLRTCNELVVVVPAGSVLIQQFEGYGYRVIAMDMVRFAKRRAFGEQLRHLVHMLKQSAHLSRIVFREDIDIVWANSVQSLLYTFSVRFCTRAKVIWTVRDAISTRWHGFLFSIFATQVICISEFISRQLPASKKSKVIYNGVDLDVWSPDKVGGAMYRLKSEEAPTVCIGNIGQLIPWKNQLHFIRIARIISNAIPNAHFFIIGDDLFADYPDYRQELKREIMDADMVDRITFLGYNDDIKAVMAGLDMLIHTAINEPLGRVILEAMAMQKIVFSYASGGVAEIIDNGKDGFLVPANDYEALAKKLLWFIEQSPEFQYSVQKSARAKVAQKFNARLLAEQITRVVE
ncbi:glycosyltransferase involved in cell wall biosynthesis [Sphingobacterium paludis]|uniref:Glycosyltransferase involved in cell wall biosynthesis n=2 Tax=Sphingobacterium paludis TaxID=1476465 RepID=A0A4R7D0Y4_9SPHI|nr:glycosyltransferase involved in cell wall biosynthesis [Sphingobacterium paludis]